MSYNEYNNSGGGGGGGASANYYDQNADFRDTRYNGPPRYESDDDFSSAAHHASEHHSSEDKSFFDSALSFIKERKGEYADSSRYEVDEAHAVNAHQAMYGQDDRESGRSHDSGTVGAGAAMQALKMFTGGSGGSDGGMDKNKLMGLAMAQASKLWDEKSASGNVSGDKQSAVNSAAEMALKMYMKGQGGGLGGTGGPSGLMGLASKFL